MKRIRDSMGSEDFPRRVFEKVFKQDIDRLRSMEDMWKMRKPPEALDFDDLAQDASSIDPSISASDQSVWSPAENYIVFTDR